VSSRGLPVDGLLLFFFSCQCRNSAKIVPFSSQGDPTSCPCTHGGCCTCALKKEPQHLDAVPEFSAAPTGGSVTVPVLEVVRTKPRLQMTHSESSLTTFANGHHKPTHKHHGNGHGSCPYSIPHVGHTGHTFGEHNGCTKTSGASAPPSVASAKPSRRIKSEQSSPDLRIYPALKMTNTCITPLELTPRAPAPAKPVLNRTASGRIESGLSVDTNSFSTVHDYTNQEQLLRSADSEGSYQFSSALYPDQSTGWPPSFRQFGSTTSFEEQAVEQPPPQYQTMDIETWFKLSNNPPALTNSTSGDEPEEVGFGGPSPPYTLNNGVLSSNSSDHAESDRYQLSANSSYVGLPQVDMSSPAYDGGEFNRLLVSQPPMSGPESGAMDAFEAGLVAGVDGLFDAGDLGMDAFRNDFSEYEVSNVSTDHLVMPASTKPMEQQQQRIDSPMVVSPPAVPPPQPPPSADETEFLWMAPWSSGPT